MAAKNLIRILIVDDHPIIREGLGAIIAQRNNMKVIAEATNGQEAIAAYALHRPDIVLMDLQMPDMDGIEAVRNICKEFPHARIIILTAHDRDEFVFRGLRAGAKAFLMKNAPRENLIDVIQTVHSGHTSISPEVAMKLATRMTMLELTVREQQILTLMTAGHSNLEIGNALFIAEATVKSHVNSILHKMRVSDRTQAVTSGLKRGLVTLE